MAAFAAHLPEVAAHAPQSGIGVVTVCAPLANVGRLLVGAEPPTLFWEAEEVPGVQATVVGWGEAVRVEAWGPRRFETLRHRSREVFSAIVENVEAGADAAPSTRLFGGFAFRTPSRVGSRWSCFADASFTMPRCAYLEVDGRAYLRFAFRSNELRDPVAVGFEMRRMMSLVGEASASSASPTLARPPAGGCVRETDATRWSALVSDALERIAAGELEKVVAACATQVRFPDCIDAGAVVERLRSAHPQCARFAFRRGVGSDAAATFVGASPEMLVERRGARVRTEALAGSLARCPGPRAETGGALLESDKDRREHAIVVEAILGTLRPFCLEIDAPHEPSLRTLPNVHHLSTPITGRLGEGTHVLQLVEAIHPTPAVCGTPRDAALAWIEAHEPDDRGWYAGAIGWFDAVGDGRFAVAIRSGLIAEHDAWLYSGAGIVRGSDPLAELGETRVKQGPLRAALGLSP